MSRIRTTGAGSPSKRGGAIAAALIALCAWAPPLYGEAIDLQRADLMRTTTVGERVFRELQGDVRVRFRDMVVDFQYGRYNPRTGVLNCVREVVLRQGGRTLWCEELTLYEDEEKAVARGRVHGLGDSLETWAERATYWDGLKRVLLEIRARVLDHERLLELRGGEIHGDHEAGFYTATRAPVLVSLEEPQSTLKARYMEWDREAGRALALREADLVSQDFHATCDSLVWLDSLGRAEFHIKPVLFREERTITGEIVEAWSRERRLDSLIVLGRGIVRSPSDSVSLELEDRLEGDRIHFSFEEGQLRRIQVRGHARSVFFALDEQRRPGMNVSDAERMKFLLEDQRLISVDMTGAVKAFWLPLQEPPEIPAAPADGPAGAEESGAIEGDSEDPAGKEAP